MGRRAKPAKAKVETKRPVVRKSSKNEDFGVRDLEKRLAEALEQQTATSEILRVISRSPTDVQPVLDAVAESAARLCGAVDAIIMRVDGDMMHRVAHFGAITSVSDVRPVTRPTPSGRAILEHRTIHIDDILEEFAHGDYLEARALQQGSGFRTVLVVPLMREDAVIGVITIRRLEVRPFTAKQMALVKTFADQAVIAIENVRLFQELQARNRELTEALEQQTATAEILGVISSSPTDVQPVFDTIVRNAVTLCEALFGAVFRFDGELIHLVAHHNFTPGVLELVSHLYPMRPSREQATGRVILGGALVHLHDALADPEYRREVAARGGWRSMLAVPMSREGTAVGVIWVARAEAGPFPDNQVELLKTFADQAVIAIENVRLFNELQARTRELGRSVEQLTALGEVGRAVSSTLDLETVLTTIVARAVQLSAASGGGVIYEYDDVTEEFRLRATHAMEAALSEALQGAPIRLGEGAMGQAGLTRAPVQVADILDERAVVLARVRPVLTRSGYRSLLAVPLLLDQRIMGGLVVWRRESGPFDPDVVNLLQTFATQSALAIQNARLFRELKEKSRQLEAASRHKSEFLANMSHELRTPLNAILGFNEMILGQIYGEVPADLQVPLTDIQNSGKHLLRLINNVLDLSKIEAGRVELALGDYSVQDTVERVRGSLRPLAADKGLEFVATISADIPLAYGDGGRITQCLMNLAGNALKFTRLGRVEIGVELQGDFLVYRVADTGIGIAPDKIESVFAEFRQGDATITSEFGGTGLGLSITKKFVEMHGGRIWVESEVGKGSTFFFAIPLRLAEGKPA